jgi:DNA-binding transcriptional MerR regulator
MARPARRSFRTREFATLAGVTARALRHYDRLGLLKPQRTASGYRAYSDGDFARLEQIVALKFIGVPLKKIALFAARTPEALVKALGAQRQVLERKRRLLDRAIHAIGEAEGLLRAGHESDPLVYRRIIEVIQMQNNDAQWKDMYEELIKAKMARLTSLSPEEATALRAEWDVLLRDVEGALGEDPAGPVAQELADRWLKRLERLMGAPIDPVMVRAAAIYQTTGRWSGGAVDKRVWDFMSKALSFRQ